MLQRTGIVEESTTALSSDRPGLHARRSCGLPREMAASLDERAMADLARLHKLAPGVPLLCAVN